MIISLTDETENSLFDQNENYIAIEVDGGVSRNDVKTFARLYKQKLEEGHERVNILLILEKLDIFKVNPIALLEERIWGIKNYKTIGNVAVVSGKRPADWIEKAVSVEAAVLIKANPQASQRYYDVKDIKKAWEFVAG